MDLALALVDEDLGRDVALMTARQLVLFVARPGGQSQFSAQLAAQVAVRDPLRDLQGWIAEHPDADHSVERLAARVAMSPRHFAACSVTRSGVPRPRTSRRCAWKSPRRLLETTGLSAADVARASGFGTPETLRRAFSRRVGASPIEYRDRFRPAQAG